MENEKLVRRWFRFIGSMKRLEHDWKLVNELAETMTRDEMQMLPIQVQKGITMFGRSKFTVMLPRFVDYMRTVGGLESLMMPKEIEEKEESDE